jgi:putative FmdB family regulatory protein
MPRYLFACAACKHKLGKRLEAGQQTNPQSCPRCGAVMERAPSPPSTQVLETLDNGIMARRVERLANAEELLRERAKSDPSKRRD